MSNIFGNSIVSSVGKSTSSAWTQIENKPSIDSGIAENSIVEGLNTAAGCKGFNITAVSPYGYTSVNPGPESIVLTLDSVEGLSVGDVCSVVINKNYMNLGAITAIDENSVTIDHYPSDLTSSIIDSTTIGGGEYVPFLFVATKQDVGTTVFGSEQHAEGYSTIALMSYSHAEGRYSVASGKYSHAEGDQTFAGYASHAEGQKSTAIGLVSHAEGSQTTASGDSSHAEGNSTTASGTVSHAEGGGTIASGERSHAEGSYTKATVLGAHAEGTNTTASGTSAHSEGATTEATGDYSHAEGQSSRSTGVSSHSEGVGSNATGQASHAEGDHANAVGEGSHSEGSYSYSYGPASHAEGRGTKAGLSDNASAGDGAHAEGRYTKATGQAAHAEGNSTEASGAHSHAEGTNSKATAARTHAEGFATIATIDSQHVQGKYNAEDSTAAHIVGWGTSDSDRKNIHTLSTHGNSWFSKDVRVGGSSYAEGKQLATTEYVDDRISKKIDLISHDVEVLKRAAYDNIYTISTTATEKNPVLVDEGVMLAANISSIGPGMIEEVINFAPITESSYGQHSAAVIIDANNGIVKLPAGDYFSSEELCVGMILPEPLAEGADYFFGAELLSGEYTTGDGGPLNIVDENNISEVGKPCWVTAGWERTQMNIMMLLSTTLHCTTDVILKIYCGATTKFSGTPVVAVKHNNNIVYRVPEDIINLRATLVDEQGTQRNDCVIHGVVHLTNNEERLYNSLDLDNKRYIVRCGETNGETFKTQNETFIDLSEYISDTDGEILVSTGDKVTFVGSDLTSFSEVTPNEISYIIKRSI
jgi:hypothetical protein